MKHIIVGGWSALREELHNAIEFASNCAGPDGAKEGVKRAVTAVLQKFEALTEPASEIVPAGEVAPVVEEVLEVPVVDEVPVVEEIVPEADPVLEEVSDAPVGEVAPVVEEVLEAPVVDEVPVVEVPVVEVPVVEAHKSGKAAKKSTTSGDK